MTIFFFFFYLYLKEKWHDSQLIKTCYLKIFILLGSKLLKGWEFGPQATHLAPTVHGNKIIIVPRDKNYLALDLKKWLKSDTTTIYKVSLWHNISVMWIVTSLKFIWYIAFKSRFYHLGLLETFSLIRSRAISIMYLVISNLSHCIVLLGIFM